VGTEVEAAAAASGLVFGWGSHWGRRMLPPALGLALALGPAGSAWIGNSVCPRSGRDSAGPRRRVPFGRVTIAYLPVGPGRHGLAAG